MRRKTRLSLAILVVVSVVPATADAAIYSATQTELLGLQYVDFIGNTAPDNATVHSVVATGTDGVRITFDTDYDIGHNLWRVATEKTSVIHDLSGLDSFDLLISDPIAPAGINLSAQIFVRSVDNILTSSNARQLGAFPITLSIPVSRIINQGGDPSNITSFGVEFFGGDEFLGHENLMATVRTAPQPPNLVDHTLYSWEGSADGWTAGFQPDHVHSLSSTGATLGTGALKIVRTVTGNPYPAGSLNTTFRWGSQINLDANSGPSTPNDYNNNRAVDAGDYVEWRKGGALQNETITPGSATPQDYTVWRQTFGNAASPDPTTLAKIANIASLINDPASYSVSFDLRLADQYPDPNPQWANFTLSIGVDDNNPTTAGGQFWQSQQIDIDLSELQIAPVQMTLDFLLSQFDDQSRNGVQNLKTEGIFSGSQYLSFSLASNFPAGTSPKSYTFFIDNFRIRSIAPGSGSQTPEPSGAFLAAIVSFFAGLGMLGRNLPGRLAIRD